ncbi:MAG: hypothetical protein HKN23_20220 [Verrucomicrobiales bacterium]|nr:hypothetical protein [Verrucomicrobiales bacterium]
MPYLSTTPVTGTCQFSAADLEGKKLKWNLPDSPLEVSSAPASLMLSDDAGDGNVSVALKDAVESEHRDSDGQPVMIDVFGVWLTQEGLNLLKKCEDDSADFEAVAE